MDWTIERKEQLEILDRLLKNCAEIPCHPVIKADALRLMKYELGGEEIKTSFIQFLNWIKIQDSRKSKNLITYKERAK